MGKQTHILCLSPVFQPVMGCGLKLRGLQTDLYAFFKQGSVFQICGRTSRKRTCAGGSGCKHRSVCCSSQGAAEWTVAGAGGLEHLCVELLTGSFLWFIDKLITMENSVAPSISVWPDLLLDLTPFLVYCLVLICFVLVAVDTFLQKQQPWPLKQNKMLYLHEKPSAPGSAPAGLWLSMSWTKRCQVGASEHHFRFTNGGLDSLFPCLSKLLRFLGNHRPAW